MQGIDELTNIMQAGGRSDVPMNMGAQPMGAPQGIAGMMPPQDMAMMQQEQVPNPADSAPQGVDINSDADMLASAVVGRTNGDLDEAEQVLEQSLMLIKSAKSQTQQPTMAAYGKPIMAAEGKPIPSGTDGAGLRALPDEVVERMGFVKAADGRAMMRSMIADSLSKKPEEKKMMDGGPMKYMDGGPMKYADGGEMEKYAGGGVIYLP
mgnify:CR=1 FL=1|jgi:hypothetical protein